MNPVAEVIWLAALATVLGLVAYLSGAGWLVVALIVLATAVIDVASHFWRARNKPTYRGEHR